MCQQYAQTETVALGEHPTQSDTTLNSLRRVFLPSRASILEPGVWTPAGEAKVSRPLRLTRWLYKAEQGICSKHLAGQLMSAR